MQNRYYIQISACDKFESGTLWHSIDGINLESKSDNFCKTAKKTIIVESNCIFDKSRHNEIDKEKFRFLLAAKPSERIHIYQSPEKLLNLFHNIKVGSSVLIIQIGDHKNVTGTVKCIFSESLATKSIIKDEEEIWQRYICGILLDEKFATFGNSDGTFLEKRFFECEEDCAVFYGLSRLRPLELKVDDQVIHFDDFKGELTATVKWIGLLPGKNDTIYAGVEFDSDAGSGTGKYLGQQLFIAKRKHASFIPINGLFKKEIFESFDDSDSLETPVIEPQIVQAPITKRIDYIKNYQFLTNEITGMAINAMFNHNTLLKDYLKYTAKEKTFRGEVNNLLLDFISNPKSLLKDVDKLKGLISCEVGDSPDYIDLIRSIFESNLNLNVSCYKYKNATSLTKDYIYPSSFSESLLSISPKYVEDTCLKCNIQDILNAKFDRDMAFLSLPSVSPILIVKIENPSQDLKLSLNISIEDLFLSCCGCNKFYEESKISETAYYILCKDCLESRSPNELIRKKGIYCSTDCHSAFNRGQIHLNLVGLQPYIESKSLDGNRYFSDKWRNFSAGRWWLYSFVSNVGDQFIHCNRTSEHRDDWDVYSNGNCRNLNLTQFIESESVNVSHVKDILSNVNICFYAPQSN